MRRRAAEQAPGLRAQHQKLTDQIPAHNAELKASFTKEWAEGIAAFGRLLGKREQFEKLLGEKIALPTPSAVVVDLGPAAEPKRLLTELGSAIAATGGGAPFSPDPRSLLAHYDPALIYRLQIPFDDQNGSVLAPGALICDASFGGGWTDALVRVGDARPIESPEYEQARAVAHAADLEAKRNALEPAPVTLSGRSV